VLHTYARQCSHFVVICHYLVKNVEQIFYRSDAPFDIQPIMMGHSRHGCHCYVN